MYNCSRFNFTRRGGKIKGSRKGAVVTSNTYTYYAIIDDDHPVHNPLGVVRRRIVDGFPLDEAFTRNLKWQSSPMLQDIQHGRSYDNPQEITREQAEAFVKFISKKLQPEFIAQNAEEAPQNDSS